MSFVGVLLYVLVLFLIAGFTAWLINLFVPAEGPYKRAALGILGLIVFLIVLSLLWPFVATYAGPGPRTPVIVRDRRE